MRGGVSGAPCPECESIRTQTLGTGYTDDGLRLRRRRCVDCGAPSFITVEVMVPATWGELETNTRMKQRDYFRRRNNYQGRTALARYRPKARLDVKVTVRRESAA